MIKEPLAVPWAREFSRLNGEDDGIRSISAYGNVIDCLIHLIKQYRKFSVWALSITIDNFVLSSLALRSSQQFSSFHLEGFSGTIKEASALKALPLITPLQLERVNLRENIHPPKDSNIYFSQHSLCWAAPQLQSPTNPPDNHQMLSTTLIQTFNVWLTYLFPLFFRLIRTILSIAFKLLVSSVLVNFSARTESLIRTKTLKTRGSSANYYGEFRRTFPILFGQKGSAGSE